MRYSGNIEAYYLDTQTDFPKWVEEALGSNKLSFNPKGGSSLIIYSENSTTTLFPGDYLIKAKNGKLIKMDKGVFESIFSVDISSRLEENIVCIPLNKEDTPVIKEVLKATVDDIENSQAEGISQKLLQDYLKPKLQNALICLKHPLSIDTVLKED